MGTNVQEVLIPALYNLPSDSDINRMLKLMQSVGPDANDKVAKILSQISPKTKL